MAITKAELVDQRLRDRRDVGLYEWVEQQLEDGVSWRSMERELTEAVGWGVTPITRSGLYEWYRREQART